MIKTLKQNVFSTLKPTANPILQGLFTPNFTEYVADTHS